MWDGHLDGSEGIRSVGPASVGIPAMPSAAHGVVKPGTFTLRPVQARAPPLVRAAFGRAGPSLAPTPARRWYGLP